MSVDEIIHKLDAEERALLRFIDMMGAEPDIYMPTMRAAYGLAGWGLLVRRGAGTSAEMWHMTDSGKAVRRGLDAREIAA